MITFLQLIFTSTIALFSVSIFSTPFKAHEVPGVIQAEDYDTLGPGQSHADFDATNHGQSYRINDHMDIYPHNNGFVVGSLHVGEWMNYTFTPSKTTEYRLSLFGASIDGGGLVEAKLKNNSNSEETVLTFELQDSGSWRQFIPSRNTQNISLDKNTSYTLKLFMLKAGRFDNKHVGDLDYFSFEEKSTLTDSLPFQGQNLSLPGKIEAEEYDRGPAGISHVDFDSGNNGNHFRNDGDADIYPSENGPLLGSLRAGEWLKYSISVENSDYYQLSSHLASVAGGGIIEYILVDTNGQERTLSSVTVPDTGSFRNFTTVKNEQPIFIEQGNYFIKVFMKKAGNFDGVHIGDIDYFVFNYWDQHLYENSPDATPYNNQAHNVPGIFEAEHYNQDGPGLSFQDQDSGNQGNSTLRTSDDVDISQNNNDNTGISNMANGEWLSYQVKSDIASWYQVKINVKSTNSGRLKGRLFFNQQKNIDFDINIKPNQEAYSLNNIFLEANEYQFKIFIDHIDDSIKDDVHLDTVEFTNSGPYKLSKIPGKLEVEDFDIGPLSHADFDNNNQGQQYRIHVDADISKENQDTFLTQTRTGEWLKYTVEVEKSQKYYPKMRYRSVHGGKLKVYSNNEEIIVDFPTSNGQFKVLSLPALLLNQGLQEVNLTFISENSPSTNVVDLDYIHFEENQKVQIIFDTDMESDLDDCGNLGMLHAMADNNELDLLAVMHSSTNTFGAGAIDVINTYFKRPNIPIGAFRGNYRNGELDMYRELTQMFPSNIKRHSQSQNAASLYRKILSEAEDNSIVIIVVGFTTNLATLLDTRADQYSSLNGIDLVAKKVKRVVQMATQGRSFNLHHNGAGVYAKSAYSRWPTEVFFSPSGYRVETGSVVKAKRNANPITHCFKRNPYGSLRHSWDQVASFFAVRGNQGFFTEQKNGYNPVTTTNNRWQSSPNRKHHLITLKPSKRSEMRWLIDQWMAHEPK